MFIWKLHVNQQNHQEAARAVVKSDIFLLVNFLRFPLSFFFFGSHQLVRCLTQLCTGTFWRNGEASSCTATGFSGSKGGSKFPLGQTEQHRNDIKFLSIRP